jgi:deoxyribose-phosphate aldolase
LKPEELAGKIDHSLLSPDARRADFERFVENSLRYPFASLCVPPSYVAYVRSLQRHKKTREEPAPTANETPFMAIEPERLRSSSPVCAVVGFPFGCQTLKTKLFEAKEAIRLGAGELDAAANITYIKSGEYYCGRPRNACGWSG